MIYDENKIEGLEITITEDMIKDGLKGDDLLVYALIKDLTKENDAIFSPDAKEVAECLNIPIKNAMESLRNLVDKGFIDEEITKAGRKVLAREYHISPDKTRRKLAKFTVHDVKTNSTATSEYPAW